MRGFPGHFLRSNLTSNPSLPSPTLNATNTTEVSNNATVKPFSVFDGCEGMEEGILFDLAIQLFNVVLGIPANILVIVILIKQRHEPTTSDIFLGCLAFMDAYFGAMTPIIFANLYHWQSMKVWMAIKFAYGVKDTSGPLFLSCICLDRFVAVILPIAFGQLKHPKYRISLSVFVLCLTFAYAAAKMFPGLPDFEKIFTGEVLATFVWMMVCNASILLALKRSKGAGKDEMHPMKKKAFKMVLSIMVIIIVNYLPPVALFPFEEAYSADAFRCYVQPVGFAFLNISSSIQPMIYLSRLEKVPFLPEAWTARCCGHNQPDKNSRPNTKTPTAAASTETIATVSSTTPLSAPA